MTHVYLNPEEWLEENFKYYYFKHNNSVDVKS